MMKRDFVSLTTQEALWIAILIEERNTEIYHQIGELFAEFCPKAPEVARPFFDMAEAERQHGHILSERYLQRFGALNNGITENDVREFIEVPRFGVGDIIAAVDAGHRRTANRIALEIADDAERTALKFYKKLAATTADPEMKSLCEEFAEFEQEHADWVEGELTKKNSCVTPIT